MNSKAVRSMVLGAGLALNQAGAESLTIDTVPTGLTVVADGTNYTAPVTFGWVAGSLHEIEAPAVQVSGDGHSRFIFGMWSDGQALNHSFTMPAYDTNCTATFSTQYLLDVAVTPIGAGTVSNYPTGPWYDPGQQVALTAKTNTGYRFSFWQGIDSAASNIAQVTMSGYRAVQTGFLPAEYPYLVVTNFGGAAPGSFIGNIGGRNSDGTRLHYVVLDNTGTNLLFASKTNGILRFTTPQGFLTATNSSGFQYKDETLNIVESFTTLGYSLDPHDMKLLPNGHALLFSPEVRTFDLSAVVPGGKPAASIIGNVIQEIDANKRLVFEWHTFDHIALTNSFADLTQASLDYAHVNAVTIDPIDNQLLASLRTTSEIVKINRRTGEIIWRLGGKRNMFTFIGEHPENAPYYTVGQHDVHRLANGNLIFFDNGNISGGGVTPSDRSYSRVVEYALNEVSMTATLVWEFRHTPDISAGCTGSLKRFANGNTLIDWGCAVPSSGTILTEVNAAGQVVFEMKHRTNNGISTLLLGGGLTKQPWNTADLVRSVVHQGIQAGQTYAAAAAGATVTVNSLSGPAENALVVRRHLDAVRFAQFLGKAPQVVMEHMVLLGSNINSFQGQISLNLPETNYVFDTPMIQNAAQLVVYQRPIPGQGQFVPLSTTYDPEAHQLRLSLSMLGELIFAYPDIDETPYIPGILSPADQSQVNQAQPITLVWGPRGLVGSFDLQVATDAAFANLLLTTNGLGSATFTLQNTPANAQLFWRVRTVNQGGTSQWASASFSTVPPMLEITEPAGGEVWQRFQVVTIRWVDNISENVALDLYLDGLSNRTFAANVASSGSFTWTVGQFSTLPQSTNYTIKIRSTTNPALFDFSEKLSIISNLTAVTVATIPPGLTVKVDGTNYLAPAVFSWLPTSSHSLETASPQVSSDGHSRFSLTAWSDGGAQNHSMVVPFSPTTNTAAFSTNYLLDFTLNPAGAGSIAADPTGPWYNPGELVSLTANPNAGYRFYSWQGVDSQSNNTAQLTMSSYKAVQATLLPVTGIPFIDKNSFVRLADGSVQFSITAGAGVVTQATIWAATTFSPADWQIIGTVPLTAGSGVFVDEQTAGAIRFYRVSLP